jgi:hypothetical protein
MKRHFGTWATRSFLGSGVTLSDGEHHLLSLLVSELPPHLREKVERQFELYNLVQREIDKRTLNFYRSRAWRRGQLPVTPILKSKLEVAPLVRLSLNVAGQPALMHVVLTAVNGRAFCVSFSRVVARYSKPEDYSIQKVTQAWLSNFDEEEGAA